MTKKLVLDIDEASWKEVKKFQIDNDIKHINDAVVELVKTGLKTSKKA